MAEISVKLKRLAHAKGLALPAHATALSAGADLVAAVDHPVTLGPGERAILPTGLAIALPTGYEAQVRPRSGLAANHGVSVLNSPGTIDADYRGEVGVILINHGAEPFTIERGMRIAQMIVAPVVRVIWRETADLDSTERGQAGFGSTGTAPAG